jgi:hypothetical protein
MKYLKMLGLAAIAAMALMAFGAGTASATTLFTDSAKTVHYAAGTEIQATLTTGTTAILTGSGGEVLDTCSGSEVKGKTATTSGAPLSGGITTLDWKNCTNTTVTIAKGSLSIEFTSGTSGSVSGKENEVTVDGIFGVSCTYGTGSGTKLGTITGGEAPKMKISAVGLTKTAGSFLCPSSAGWDAEYTVTKPHALYVGA